jgi:hypothetical protein
MVVEVWLWKGIRPKVVASPCTPDMHAEVVVVIKNDGTVNVDTITMMARSRIIKHKAFTRFVMYNNNNPGLYVSRSHHKYITTNVVLAHNYTRT